MGSFEELRTLRFVGTKIEMPAEKDSVTGMPRPSLPFIDLADRTPTAVDRYVTLRSEFEFSSPEVVRKPVNPACVLGCDMFVAENQPLPSNQADWAVTGESDATSFSRRLGHGLRFLRGLGCGTRGHVKR